MVYGPCGGVRADHGCELGDRPCPFAGRPPLRWAGPPAPAPAGSPRVPLVLTDLTVRPYDPASLRRVVRILAPASDGLLVGEHQNRRTCRRRCWPPRCSPPAAGRGRRSPAGTDEAAAEVKAAIGTAIREAA